MIFGIVALIYARNFRATVGYELNIFRQYICEL